jgi:hypothetical protein
MKQTLTTVLLCAVLFVTSCSKGTGSNPEEPPTGQSTVLLTKVINNTKGDQDFGKTLAEFTYNGKQLLQAAIYSYSNVSTFKETHTFAYTSQNQLTGSTITNTNYNNGDFVNSVAAYTGSNLSKLTFNKASGISPTEHTLTYDGSKLTRWFTPNEVEILYTYNSDGNNTKQIANEYTTGRPNGYVYTDNYLTFDTKHNPISALPNWIYFRVNTEEEGLGYAPGPNNPVTMNENGTSYTYVYEYNNNGYPTTITKVGSGTNNRSWTYEYKVVN